MKKTRKASAFPEKYNVKAFFVLGRKPEDLDHVKRILKEANQELLLRGAKQPENGATVTKAGVEGNALVLEILAGKQVTGPEAVMRLKNALARDLGRVQRIGVRKVTADVMVRTRAEVQGAERKGEWLVFRNVQEETMRKGIIQQEVKKAELALEQQETEEGLVHYGYVLRKGGPRAEELPDFHPLLEEKGWARRYPAKGQWVYAPEAAEAIQEIINRIKERVLKPLGFREWIFPRLTPIATLEKALPVYLEKIPDGMFYACAPPRDPNAFKEFKQEFVRTRRANAQDLKKVLKPPAYVLEPAQCIPFYQYHEGKKLGPEEYPVKAMEVLGGWTWRNEAGGVEGILKTNEFLRLETVYLGTPEQVKKIRRQLLEKTTTMIEEIGLEYRWVIGAPFYVVGDETKEGIKVDPGNLDEIPTVDLEARLPYNGKWLEITAFNVHGNKYTKGFRIKAENREELWTGCTGYGITRWLAAFLAQRGLQKTRKIFGGG